MMEEGAVPKMMAEVVGCCSDSLPNPDSPSSDHHPRSCLSWSYSVIERRADEGKKRERERCRKAQPATTLNECN